MHVSVNSLPGDRNGVVGWSAATGAISVASGGTRWQNVAAVTQSLTRAERSGRACYSGPKPSDRGAGHED